MELKALQERVGITFVHVTHDQEEALAISDRLAVLRNGRVEQVGTPAEVYEEPAYRVRGRLRGRLEPASRARSRPPSPATPSRSRCVPSESGCWARRALGGEDRARHEGSSRDVVYLGMLTRYRGASWTGGSELVVAEQNRRPGPQPKSTRRARGSACARLGSRRQSSGRRRAVTGARPCAACRPRPLGRRLLLALLLGPPLLWLGVVYLGSLLALVVQSFFHLDGFTGHVVRRFGLATWRASSPRPTSISSLRTSRWPRR